MKVVYPVVITQYDDGMHVSIPDCETSTCGTDLADALVMAKDIISLSCMYRQDDGEELPTPTEISQIPHEEGDIVELVECDLDEYRQMLANMQVNKRVKIPRWLDKAAKNANINFSQFLQQALKAELGVEKPI